ncbi:hypothetical protein DPMN_169096 [Dreissena polymorpha]|uniref:Uncharacterized protein n=1 Tax=Dreissena polymorpha TaxID=45954 RepID=A0A9D4F4L7_DREPO|nr:hypothetical protein DPMN_169096 [Dreissena polymorpha]
MNNNLLKINADKTEVIIFVPKHIKTENFTVKIGTAVIKPTTAVRNLGAILDSHLDMEKQSMLEIYTPRRELRSQNNSVLLAVRSGKTLDDDDDGDDYDDDNGGGVDDDDAADDDDGDDNGGGGDDYDHDYNDNEPNQCKTLS